MVEINDNFALLVRSCKEEFMNNNKNDKETKDKDKVNVKVNIISGSEKHKMSWQVWRRLTKKYGTGPFEVVEKHGDSHVEIMASKGKCILLPKKFLQKIA